MLQAIDDRLVDGGRLQDDLEGLVLTWREREALLVRLLLALHGAGGVDRMIAGVDGDALLEERGPHRDAVERDLDARGVGGHEQLHVGDARQEIGDFRLGGF